MSTRHVALVYARKSVVKTKADEVSPERQLSLCSDAAREHGWAIETFVDAEGHRSGGSEKHRPEWRRLKAQLARSDVAAVIVADITRASRSPKDFYNFLDECNRRGVQFISLKQAIDTTTAHGRAMLGMSLIFSAWEREIASERALVAINFKRDNGRHVGNAPFGTKRDADGVLVESADWPTCQIVLEQYATGNFSLYTLPYWLNADPRGLRFRNRAGAHVRSIIANVLTYAGYIARGHGKQLSLPYTLDESSDAVASFAECVGAIRGSHAPLISRELAERVIRVRQQKLQPRGDLERRVYILVPVLRCAFCGMPMRGLRRSGRALYIHAGKVCRPREVVLDAPQLEQRALEQLSAMRLTPERREDLKRRVEERMRAVPEHVETLATMQNLEAKLERLKQLYIEGDVDRAQYEQQRRITRHALEEQRAKLGPRTISLDVLFDQLDSLADILVQGAPVQQRRAIQDLFTEIHVDFSGNIAKMLARAWVSAVFPLAAPEPTQPLAHN